MKNERLMESLFQWGDKQTHQLTTEGTNCCAGNKLDSVIGNNWAGRILDDMIIQVQMTGSYELKSETWEGVGHGKNQGKSPLSERTEL